MTRLNKILTALIYAAPILATPVLTRLVFADASPAAAGRPIAVGRVWARATPPGATSAAVYLTIEDRGPGDDRLIGATTPAAGAAALHSQMMAGDVMRMRPIDGVPITAGETVALRPGGVHLMLTGLTAPLTAGRSFTLTLRFERAGPVDTTVSVAPIGADPPDDGMAQGAADRGATGPIGPAR